MEQDEQRQALLHAAVESYRRMHQMSPDNFTAPASLTYIAGRYQVGGHTQGYWFARLREAADRRVLQAEDLNALSMLVSCQLADICTLPAERMDELLAVVYARTRQRHYVDELRGRLLAARPGMEQQAAAAYRRAIDAAPGYAPAYYGLASLLNREQLGGEAVEVLRRLSARDGRRLQLAPLAYSLDFEL